MTTKPWSLLECCQHFSAAGIQHITIWRNVLAELSLTEAAKMVQDHALQVTSLCRGGFFPSKNASKRREAIDDNKLAIDQAAAVGAPVVVLVCGADRGQTLVESRQQIQDGITELLPYAEANQVKLAIEPLHPMYADDRSAVNTLEQANAMAEALGSSWVGVALDVYHLWWDPNLQTEIQRCGKQGNLLAFHVCDWKTPTTDLVLDRGLMGEGCIDIQQIRSWVEATGFSGPNEVEIFSNIYWADDQKDYLKRIIEAYRQHC
jgi:sugar phosphate isomerase/epimerase